MKLLKYSLLTFSGFMQIKQSFFKCDNIALETATKIRATASAFVHVTYQLKKIIITLVLGLSLGD